MCPCGVIGEVRRCVIADRSEFRGARLEEEKAYQQVLGPANRKPACDGSKSRAASASLGLGVGHTRRWSAGGCATTLERLRDQFEAANDQTRMVWAGTQAKQAPRTEGRSAGAGGRDRGRAWWLPERQEDLIAGCGLGDEGDDAQVGAAVGDVCRILSHLAEGLGFINRTRSAVRRNPLNQL